GVSGVLTTSIGVPGPPLLLYFSGAGIDKTTLRSTTLAYYLFVYFASLMMQISFGGTNKETWMFSLIAIPPLFIGVFLGQLLRSGVSGVLTTSIGVTGPRLLLYFSGAGIDKTTLRSTTLAYYLFVYFASLMMQISFGGTNKETWMFSLIAIPPLFIGVFLGQFLFKRISQLTFLIITYIILLFTGAYLVITSI